MLLLKPLVASLRLAMWTREVEQFLGQSNRGRIVGMLELQARQMGKS